MHLFISEFVCGGAWPEAGFCESLACEGRAMLEAIVADASQLPARIETTWDVRLSVPQWTSVHIHPAHDREEEWALFQRLATECDRTLMIAPEFHGYLGARCRFVEILGGKLAGPSSVAVDFCADKLILASVLSAAGVPTIPTDAFDRRDPRPHEMQFPAVVKPREGAGSQNTYLVKSHAELARLAPTFDTAELMDSAIWQPFIPGRALSVAVLIDPDSNRYDPWPVAEQVLSTDGRFGYQGGVIPARGVDPAPIQAAAVAACTAVSGLRGYVGVDLILPENGGPPLVVEINPRLTTSYLGYRRLAMGNLAERVLFPERCSTSALWKSETVAFDAAGCPS